MAEEGIAARQWATHLPADARGDEADTSKALLPSQRYSSEGARGMRKLAGVLLPLRWSTVAFLLGFQAVVLVACACAYIVALRVPYEQRLEVEARQGRSEAQRYHEMQSLLREENLRLQHKNTDLSSEVARLRGTPDSTAEIQRLRQEVKKAYATQNPTPYRAITGQPGHVFPEMYGKVPEKTIWSFWYHPADCPNSRQCALPPHLQLCVESIERNRGSFQYKVVHLDEVPKYVSMTELPFQWHRLQPAQQKDSLMSALLARYGGVALDISVIMLRPLDKTWDEMVRKGATFRGYMYRINGAPWRHAEASVVWFLMSRREGIFSTAVRNQVIGMGDRPDTNAYRKSYLALGDQTLCPILEMYDYNLPKCYDDPTVKDHTMCPEHEHPHWSHGITGPPLNDTRIIIKDPREGPQLPFAWLGMELWDITDDTFRGDDPKWQDNALGAPMHGCKCTSMKQCWEDVFLPRLNAPTAWDEGELVFLVKFFKHAFLLDGMDRQMILSKKNSYFYNFLKLSGLPEFI